jgi:hypothetical protein
MKKLHDNYRIVVYTEKSGKQKYQVEQRFLWFFWRERMFKRESQAEAEEVVQYLVKCEQEEIDNKIVDKQVLYYPKNKD